MSFLQAFLVFAAGGVTVIILEVLKLEALLAPVFLTIETLFGRA